jgi:hypothetical protein
MLFSVGGINPDVAFDWWRRIALTQQLGLWRRDDPVVGLPVRPRCSPAKAAVSADRINPACHPSEMRLLRGDI